MIKISQRNIVMYSKRFKHSKPQDLLELGDSRQLMDTYIVSSNHQVPKRALLDWFSVSLSSAISHGLRLSYSASTPQLKGGIQRKKRKKKTAGFRTGWVR